MSLIKVADIQGRTATQPGISLLNTDSSVDLKSAGEIKLRTSPQGVELGGGLDLYCRNLDDAPTVQISMGNGNIQTWTLAQNSTVEFHGDFGIGCFVLLFVTKGSYTVTWPTSGILWSGGSEPELSETYTHCLKIYKISSTQIAIFDEGVVY